MPDRRQADGAKTDRVRRAGAFLATGLDILAGLGKMGRTCIDVIIGWWWRPGSRKGGFRDGECRIGHIGADTVPADNGNSG